MLRIDILRTGDTHTNSISIEAFHSEPLWSGCRSKTIEPYNYGDYKIEITDPSSGKLLFLYSWSSLFAEYAFTEEGQTITKTFEESVRIPFPAVPVTIQFFQRQGQSLDWIIQHTLSFDPGNVQFQVTPIITSAKGEKIYDSSPPEKAMDIALIAEGYTAEQYKKFKTDAVRISEFLLKCDPYTKYLQAINFWIVFLPSEEEGVTDPSADIMKNTAFGFNFSTFGTDRYLMTEKHFQLRDAASAVPYDHIIIIVNTEKYGGGGIYNFYASCPSDNSNSDFLIIHEFGHSFAGLADEYWTSDVSVMNYYNTEFEPYEPNITTLVDFESKWKDMLEPNTPIPTPIDLKDLKKTGVYEGGGYSATGIFRPSPDCTMKSVRYNAFCPVCQRSIERTILHFIE